MKTLLTTLFLLSSLLFSRAYNVESYTYPLASGTTNTQILDISDSSQVSIQISLTGQLVNGTIGSLTITNVAGTVNGYTFTNVLAGVTNTFLFTNTPGSNLNYVQAVGDSATSTTNLYQVLTNFYGTNLLIAFGSATNLTLTTPLNAVFTGTILSTMGTFTFTTNAINGGVICVCSNSIDKVTWFQDSTHNVTVNFNGTSLVNSINQFTNAGAMHYYQYSLQNASGNNANAPFFIIQKGSHSGF